MMTMTKLFRKVHLWVSVPFGIVIALTCFSGAMLVFEAEITQAVSRNVYYVESAEGEPMTLDALVERVRVTLPDSVEVSGITVFNDPTRTLKVQLSEPRGAALFVDPYSGEITGEYKRPGFFSAMTKLHRRLLFGGDSREGNGAQAGKLLVGISTLVFVVTLLTGVVIWWPRARNHFAHSLSIPFRSGRCGFWKGLHVAGGMYALIIVLAMALTGLTWSFNWYRSAFYRVCGVEYASGPRKDAAQRHGPTLSHQTVTPAPDMWQQAYNDLKVRNADATQLTVTPSPTPAATTDADRLRKSIYSIHTGSFGGIFTRIIWFIAALLGASLPLTGYYILLHHSRKTVH